MLIGHAEQGAAFRAAFDAGLMHHAWLLTGPQGIGKSTFADAAAGWLLARAAGPQAGIAADSLDIDADHPIARLLAAGSHLDMRRIERSTDSSGKLRAQISIDEVRTLQPLFRHTPALSNWRVVIVDSIDDLNRNAANALLKNLEEPPPGTLFLCISHAPGRLLPTIRSRCRALRFDALGDGEVAQVLDAARPNLSEADRAALIRVAAGAPGRALRFADVGVAALEAELAELAVAPPHAAPARALLLARSLAAKTATARYEAFLELVPAAIAHAARDRRGARLARALALWEKASALAASAVALSLEPQSVAFDLAMLVSGLAEA